MKTIQEAFTDELKNHPSISKRIVKINLNRYLSKSNSKAREHAIRLMPNHVFLLETASAVLLLLARFVDSVPLRNTNPQGFSYACILHRCTNYILCIYQLLITGYEDTARVLTRSYFEALDISLACLTNKEFAQEYLADDGDHNILWRKFIGYGRIHKFVESALLTAGFDKDEIKARLQRRREQMTTFSYAVHGDHPGSFRSFLPPALGYPDMLSLDKHGVISFHTANHAAVVISETYFYCATISNLIVGNHLKEILKLNKSKSSNELRKFVLYLIAFQETFFAYPMARGEDIIAEDYQPELLEPDN